MKNLKLTLLAKVGIIIFLYLIIYYGFYAITTLPTEGDSIAYHLPTAKMIFHGAVLNPYLYRDAGIQQFFPAIGETILSVFMFFRVPLNLFNITGIMALFITLIFLGIKFGLEKSYAIIFSLSFSTIHTVMRWVLSQTIDIWLVVFFSLTLLLLEKMEKKSFHFLKLGLAAGLLIGTKYTGPIFLLVLFIFYARNTYKYINISRFVAFLIPFLTFGLFWYIRNYVITGDPYFPQSIPLFKGAEFHMLDTPIWKIIFFYPNGIIRELTALWSEYTVWSLSLPFSVLFFIFGYKKINNPRYKILTKLITIGILNFLACFFLPDGPKYSLNVSVIRYTYSAFVPLILSMFILAKELKMEEFLSVIAISNMIMLPEISFHPKLLLFYIPIGLIVYYNKKILPTN